MSQRPIGRREVNKLAKSLEELSESDTHNPLIIEALTSARDSVGPERFYFIKPLISQEDDSEQGNGSVALGDSPVSNLIYEGKYQGVIDRVNIRARELGIQELQINKNGEVNYSNNFNTRLVDQVLLEEFPELRTRGVTIEQALDPEIFESMKDPSTYGELASTVVYPRKGNNEEIRVQILNLARLGSKIDVPYVVSDLGYGSYKDELIGLFEGKATAIEAPGLIYGGKNDFNIVKYDQENGRIVETERGEEGVKIWSSKFQSGARSLYRDRNGYFVARDDRLGYAGVDGRVPIFQDPQGHTENI